MATHRRRRSVRFRVILAAILALALIPAAVAFASDQSGSGYGDHNGSYGSGPGDHPGDHGFREGFAPLSQLTANPDCTLRVPAHPLTAAGLATPYVLNSAGLACSEGNEGTAAFVQAVIYNPATHALSTYEPVVENPGDNVTPPPVTLPPGAVVTIWTGFNANVLKLTGPGHRQFVNFAQQAYANSPQFFAVVNRDPQVVIPPLGTSPQDGQACPSVRDFSVVDQDQSDNVPVAYPAYGTNNGSDDNLITYIDKALGCTPWMVTDLSPATSGSGGFDTAGPLEEIQAAMFQTHQALVPGLDPFVTSGGEPNLFLQDLYRLQVDQRPTFNGHDTKAYCQNLASIGAPRLKGDVPFEQGPAPQFTNPALTLATVLEGRFAATWGNLTCPALTGMGSPY